MKPTSTLAGSDASEIQWDVVVIGAGVAGAIAAREIARAGYRVLLIDRRSFPRRKVCGACLNETSLQILEELGLRASIESLGGCPLNRFAIYQGSRSISLPLAGGLALSRESFDTALVLAAIAAGVEFLDETVASLGVDGPEGRGVRLAQSGRETLVMARAVIVATGLGDMNAAHSTEWTSHVSSSSRIGVGCVIADASDQYATGTIWMAVGKAGYVGLVRVEDGRLNVAAALDRDWLRGQGTPALATQYLLERAGLDVPRTLSDAEWQGTVPLTRSTTPVATGRVFLVGDAAGYVEPFTGEGMMWAMLSGQHVSRWVVEAVRRGGSFPAAIEGWRSEYRRVIQKPQWFCRFATGLIRSPALFALGMRAVSLSPWLAGRLAASVTSTSRTGRLTAITPH